MLKTQSVPAAAVSAALLTDQTAAEILGVEARTVRLWRRTRGLPHVRLTGKCVRIRRADLDKWLDQHAVQLRGGSR